MMNLPSRLDPGPLWPRESLGLSIGDDALEESGDPAGARKPVLGLGRGLLVVWSQGAARVIERARGILLPGAERRASAASSSTVALGTPPVGGIEALTLEEIAALEDAIRPRP